MTNKTVGIKVNHIIFVLDNSGSMSYLRDVTVSNFNEQLSELKKNAQHNQVNLISLVTFNSKVNTVIINELLSKFDAIKLEDYVPAGWTALYDGIGEAVMIADRGFEKYKDMDNSALIVILSDGMENKSVEFNREKIAEIVKAKQDSGRFTFSFLGCGEEVLKQAEAMYIPNGNTYSWDYSPKGLAGGMSVNCCSTERYMVARNAGEMATSGFYESPYPAEVPTGITIQSS
jgi:Mg-chelatase subunit ChlD